MRAQSSVSGYWTRIAEVRTVHTTVGPDNAHCCLTNNQGTASGGEGSFVARSGSGAVYRIAGGAPIYVSDWAHFGGPQPVTTLAPAQFDQLRAVPADGTFVHSVQDGAVYRIAGGAPVYVSHWDTYGGPQPTVGIDKWAIDNPDNPAAHLRAVPDNGTFVSTNQDGAVYRIAGGAPIYVSHWDTYGGPQPTVGIDKWAVDNIGHPAAHMRAVPSDGTLLSTQDGAVYRVAGGAPIYVSTWDAIGGPAPTVGIDKWAVDNPSHPAAHLRAVPADGTFLNASTGAVYRVAGGAPIFVSDWALFGGVRPYVTVDNWAIVNTAHPAAHLNRVPRDGTRVRGLPSRAHWSFRSGKRTASAAAASAVDVDDVGLGAFSVSTTDSPDGGTTKPKPQPQSAEQLAAKRLAVDLRSLMTVSKRATIDRILKRKRYSARFHAPGAGTLDVVWSKGAKRVVVARAHVVFKKASTRRITLKLTKAGVRILRRADRLKLTARARFAPKSGTPVTARRVVTLRRAKR